MLKNILDSFLYKTSYDNPFLDSIFWRNGLMICISLWVIYFNFKEKRCNRNIIFIPMIINFCTLFIALTEQSYRFTHNLMPYLVVAIMFAILPDQLDEQANKNLIRR